MYIFIHLRELRGLFSYFARADVHVDDDSLLNLPLSLTCYGRQNNSFFFMEREFRKRRKKTTHNSFSLRQKKEEFQGALYNIFLHFFVHLTMNIAQIHAQL